MVSSIVGRVLIAIGLFNLFFLFAAQAFSQEIQVINIKKNLQLNADEPVFHDYYLNAGTENGLKANTSFEVFRKVAINDQYESNSHGGTILLPVGRMKIIYSQTKLSIGRLQTLYKAKDSPIIDTTGFMVGDVLNIGSAEIYKDETKIASQAPVESQKKVQKQAAKTKKSSTKPKEQPKPQEEIKQEEVLIIPPTQKIEVSKSIPVEIKSGSTRMPASLSAPAPQITIVR